MEFVQILFFLFEFRLGDYIFTVEFNCAAPRNEKGNRGRAARNGAGATSDGPRPINVLTADKEFRRGPENADKMCGRGSRVAKEQPQTLT